MKIKFEPMNISGCYFSHLHILDDHRGSFQKIFHIDIFNDIIPRFKLGEAYITSSSKNVLRGMHFQLPPHDHSKVVICLRGKVTDVLLDLRPGHDFGQFASIDLTPSETNVVVVPKGVAHGFYAHCDNSDLLYLVDTVHNKASDSGIHWNGFGFEWPTKCPNISERDKKHPDIKSFKIPKEWYWFK